MHSDVGFEAEVREVMTNLLFQLQAHGGTFDNFSKYGDWKLSEYYYAREPKSVGYVHSLEFQLT